MNYLIIGASGHLGVVLAKYLTKKNEYVRVFVRNESSLSYLKGNFNSVSYGDVLDYNSLIKAMDGIDCVFHLAAIISLGDVSYEKMYDVNVIGTKNVIKAAKETGIKKLIYTSSVEAISYKNKETVTNTNKFHVNSKGFYSKTKALASVEVINACTPDFSSIVLSPSGVLGKDVYKKSLIENVIDEFISGRMHMYFKGGFYYVDVLDTVKAMYISSIKSNLKPHYILTGRYLTVKDLLLSMSKVTSRKNTLIRVPRFLVYIGLPIISFLYRIWKLRTIFSSDSLRILCSNVKFDCKDSIEDLDFNPRDPLISLEEEIKFYLDNKELVS
jgi:dihydroflavonol-4-reductase